MAWVFSGNLNVPLARCVAAQVLCLDRAWSGTNLCGFGSSFIGAHSKFAPDAAIDAAGGVNGHSQEPAAGTAIGALRSEHSRLAATRFFGYRTESGLGHRHHGTGDRRVVVRSCIRTTVVNTPATHTVSVCNAMVCRSAWAKFEPVPTMHRQKACLDSSNENWYGDASFGLGKKQPKKSIITS